MELASRAMQQITFQAMDGVPSVAADPVVTQAALVLLEASISHARGTGSFHQATALSEARDAVLPAAQAQQAEHRPAAVPAPTPVPTPGSASAETSRNAPCPCGSGRKFKRCHGLRAAA